MSKREQGVTDAAKREQGATDAAMIRTCLRSEMDERSTQRVADRVGISYLLLERYFNGLADLPSSDLAVLARLLGYELDLCPLNTPAKAGKGRRAPPSTSKGEAQ